MCLFVGIQTILGFNILLSAGPIFATEPSPFKQLRYDENYTYLKDTNKQTDFWDPIKYIRLPWGSGYLTLGGEVRGFYENFKNENFGSEPEDDNGWFLQRYMFHGDLHLNDRIRLFGQFKSGLQHNRNGGPRVPDEDRFDFHQGFLDLVVAKDQDQQWVVRA